MLSNLPSRNINTIPHFSSILPQFKIYGLPTEMKLVSGAKLSPASSLIRRTAIANGLNVDIVQARSHEKFEFSFRGPAHLLVVHEEGMRDNGDTRVQGLPSSTLRDFSRRLSLVPAGHAYRESFEPRLLTRVIYFYLDPVELENLCKEPCFAPRLFFEDSALLDTALKLKAAIENQTAKTEGYVEALGTILVHELVRFTRNLPSNRPQSKGGLASWQQRIVTAHIDSHLNEPILLATLAQLARLSPYYFCRAFKRSFGVPPHRYQIQRRIERAMSLLAERSHTVTEIGLVLGYSETSSFTAAFRKVTGMTPTSYQRSLG